MLSKERVKLKHLISIVKKNKILNSPTRIRTVVPGFRAPDASPIFAQFANNVWPLHHRAILMIIEKWVFLYT